MGHPTTATGRVLCTVNTWLIPEVLVLAVRATTGDRLAIVARVLVLALRRGAVAARVADRAVDQTVAAGVGQGSEFRLVSLTAPSGVR